MILRIIMAIFIPITLIVLLNLLMNGVYILVDLPTSIENGQNLARGFFNESTSGRYSYNKVISKLSIPALRNLFVIQELLTQNITSLKVEDKNFQFSPTNGTQQQIDLICHLKSYNQLIKTDITIVCENEVFVAYGKENITFFQEEWKNNLTSLLGGYSEDYIRPEILNDYMRFSLLVTILDDQKCLISQRQKMTDFVYFVQSWNPENIYRGLLLNEVVYQVNSVTNQFEIGNLTQLSRVYSNQTQEWADYLYDELNDCGYQFKTFEYLGVDNIQEICRSTLFFVSKPNIACSKFGLDIKKQFSIMFIETLSVSFRNSQVGVLVSNFNLREYFGLLFLIQFLILLYTWRQGVKVSLSLVIPLRQISTKILDQSVQQLGKQNFSPQYFQNYRNSKEVSLFLDATISLANSVKYQSNKCELDAEGLMTMSNSKKFFQKQNNLTAVGICCNNIARIHTENKRYLEALNEQEESIQIAEQELQSLCQLDDFQMKLSTSKNWFQVYDSFKKTMLTKFLGEDKIFEKLKSSHFQSPYPLIDGEQKQRSQTVQQKQQPQIISGRLSGDRQMKASNSSSQKKNNIASLAFCKKVEMSQESILKEDLVIEDDPRKIVKLKLLNRKYQLLQILSSFSNQHDQLFLNEILLLLQQMKAEAEEWSPLSSFQINFKLKVSCQLVYFYTKSNQIAKAKQLLRNLNDDQLFQNVELHSSVNVFCDIPQPIITSKFTLLSAIIDLKVNKIRSCCTKLLSILLTQMYDPNDYNYAITLLLSIFKSYQLDVSQLLELRLIQKRFEALILIDYTNQITKEQIKIAHSHTQHILSNMDSQDQVSLYAFNSILHQIFPIQNYKKFLGKSLNQLLLPPGGESQLIKLLSLAAGSLFIQEQSNLKPKTQNSNNIKQDPHRLSNGGDVLETCLQTDYHDLVCDENKNDQVLRFIILFAEMVTDYNEINIEILKQILLKRKVHLIVMAIGNQNINKIYLEKLSELTSDSCMLKPKQVYSYFQQLRPPPFIKRKYFEFF